MKKITRFAAVAAAAFVTIGVQAAPPHHQPPHHPETVIGAVMQDLMHLCGRHEELPRQKEPQRHPAPHRPEQKTARHHR